MKAVTRQGVTTPLPPRRPADLKPTDPPAGKTTPAPLEVLGSDSAHVGTVDGFSGTLLKLKQNDAGSGGSHHYLNSDLIGDIGDRIVLLVSAEEARQQWSAVD